MKDIVTVIRSNPEAYAPQLMQQAADEIELLRIGVATALKERDEARKELCHEIFTNGGLRPSEYARHRGWDCYKEDKPCQ
jgi:hypothetical protein